MIATPGRLVHLLVEVPDLTLACVRLVVFDEADRLFEMGFAAQISDIVSRLPPPGSRQIFLLSATMPRAVVKFARAGLSNPVLVRLDAETKVSDQLRMAFFTLCGQEKAAALLYIMSSGKMIDAAAQQTIIFAATRYHVEFLHELLSGSNVASVPVHGSMDMTARKINMAKFRSKKATVLIVTDVAARGIDLPRLDNVINFDFPCKPKLFVHRVGRAARAGKSGTALSLVAPDEVAYMADLHAFLGVPPFASAPTPAKLQSTQGYTYADMTPTTVHFGRFPRENILDPWIEAFNRIMHARSDLRALKKCCENAEKIYKRARTEPSRMSIKKAKYVGPCSMHLCHPIFLQCGSSAAATGGKARGRHDYLTKLANFRPSLTIMEIEAAKSGSSKPPGRPGAKRRGNASVLSAIRSTRASHQSHGARTKARTPTGAHGDVARKDKRRSGGGGTNAFCDDEFYVNYDVSRRESLWADGVILDVNTAKMTTTGKAKNESGKVIIKRGKRGDIYKQWVQRRRDNLS